MFDSEAEIFQTNFIRNFNNDINWIGNSADIEIPLTLLELNSMAVDIAKVLHNYPNANNSPECISFHLLKSVAKYIIKPSNIVAQQSFYASIFPKIWKHAILVVLHKSKGEGSRSHHCSDLSACVFV